MRKRTKRFEVCFTDSEYATLKAHATSCGLTVGAYVRQVLAQTIPKEKPDQEFYDSMRELAAIGNRVNQIAIKANALGFIDAPLLKEEQKKWSDFRLQIREQYLIPERKP